MQRIGTRVVTILPDEVAQEIVRVASDEGTTASEVIREIVCRAMKARAARKASHAR